MSSPSPAQTLDVGTLSPAPGGFPSTEAALRAAVADGDGQPEPTGDLVTALLSLGALEQERGRTVEAEQHFRRALDAAERCYGPDDLGIVPPLLQFGALLVASGSVDAAEPSLSRALAIAERHRGAAHDDVVAMINDLTRIYLARQAYRHAEPLLQRLYAVKRVKGEEHPEVATVLASLGTVRQALGEHDAAESLWRHVLAIRERTLPPNHFAIVTAIEHLAESCAARAKVEEALVLLQRARGMREVTLGHAHPSLRIASDRIADLQLQASEAALPSVPSTAFPVVPFTEPVLTAPTLVGRTTPTTGSAIVPPRAPLPPLIPMGDSQRATVDASYLPGLLAIKQELGPADDEEARIAGIAPSLVQKARVPMIVTGIAATALLIAGLTRGSPANAGAPQMVAVESFAPHDSASPKTSADSTAHVQPTLPALAAPVAPKATEKSRTESTAPAQAPTTRSSNGDVRETLIRPVKLSLVAVPTGIGAGSDSILGSATARAGAVKESSLLGLGTLTSNTSSSELSAPRLIGVPPTPLYPQVLRDRGVQGEVVVTFRVDGTGRPVMSSFAVVKSPHDLLTASVRNVVPSMRFEPATHSAPEGDLVRVPFQFTLGVR